MSKNNDSDSSEVAKDVSLYVLGEVSDKQKQIILENINKSITETSGKILLERSL